MDVFRDGTGSSLFVRLQIRGIQPDAPKPRIVAQFSISDCLVPVQNLPLLFPAKD